jgi:taurine dioxygenase
LTDPQLVAFAKHFGAPEHSPPNKSGDAWLKDFPELTCISNIKQNGQPIGSLGNGEAIWHTDMSYTDVPPSASMLYSLEIPPKGGGTHFMDMYQVYETLPNSIKERVWGKVAVHDATYTSAGEVRKIYEEFDGNTDTDRAPGAHHPLVVRHPETNKEALFLGRKSGASNIIGETDTKLFDALWDHCNNSDLSWGHQWQVGDLVVWDNRCCMHYRESFDDNDRRLMHRAQIKGSAPIAAWS